MKVLIIGGTGFVGKTVVRELLDRGDQVTIYSRGNSRPDFWAGIQHIQGDRDQHQQFIADLSGREFDAVIDNIAFSVHDAKAVVAAFQGSVSKYLVMSSVSVYGGIGHAKRWNVQSTGEKPDYLNEFIDLSTSVPIREQYLDLSKVSWKLNPDLEQYAQGKRQLERYLHETPEFPSVVLRAPIIVGPEARARRVWWYLERIQDGREIILRDGGVNVFSIGNRDDIAGAIIAAMDSPITTNRTYNIGHDEILTLKRFLSVLSARADLALNTISIPGEVLDENTNLPWSEWAYDPFSRPSAYVMSMERARRDFGMDNRPMAVWLDDILDWYRHLDRQTPSFGYDRRDHEVAFARRWRRLQNGFSKADTC